LELKKKKKARLLAWLCERPKTLTARGVLVIKDVTSILSMHRESRAEVLAALREVFDSNRERNSSLFLLLAQRDQRIHRGGAAGRHVARHESCAKEDQTGDDYHGKTQCTRAEEQGLHGATECIRSYET